MKIRWSHILKDKNARQDLVDSVSKAVQDGVDAVSDIVDRASDVLSDAVGDLIDEHKAAPADVPDIAKDVNLSDPNSLVGRISSFVDKASDVLSDAVGDLIDEHKAVSADASARAPSLSLGAGLLSVHDTGPDVIIQEDSLVHVNKGGVKPGVLVDLGLPGLAGIRDVELGLYVPGTVIGNDADNRLTASGNGYLYGGDGNDTLVGFGGSNIFDGGGGIDTVSYVDQFPSVRVRLEGSGDSVAWIGGLPGDVVRNVENVWGGMGGDILIGDAASNRLDGGFGNDILSGGEGDDVLNGRIGHDILVGGPGADRFVFSSADPASSDVIRDFNRAEGDRLDFSALGSKLDFAGGVPTSNAVWFRFDGEYFEIFVDTDGQVLTPEIRVWMDATNDLVREDLLLPGDDGSAGAPDVHQVVVLVRPDSVQDAAQAQSGAKSSSPDIVVSGDQLKITAGAAHSLSFDFSAPDLADTLFLVGKDDVTNVIKGSRFVDKLFGGSGNDRIYGEEGYDLLVGRGGSDILSGGAGNDRLVGGDGVDYLTGGEGADKLVGGESSDAFQYRSLSETLGDVIADFNQEEGDRICLYGIDSDTTQPGEQAFRFTDEVPVAHSLWYQVAEDGHGLTLYGDVDGDATTHEMAVAISGVTILYSEDIIDCISVPDTDSLTGEQVFHDATLIVPKGSPGCEYSFDLL